MDPEKPVFDSEVQEGSSAGGKGAVTGIAAVAVLLASVFMFFVAAFVVLLIVANPVLAIVAMADKVFSVFGLNKEEGKELQSQIPDSLREQIEEDDELMELVKQTYDCSSLPPEERQPGKNCVEGALFDGNGANGWSPIPATRQWMVPVWKSAAKRYGLEWQLLAAVNGMRSSFGIRYCDESAGIGFYQMPEALWERNSLEAGDAEESDSGRRGSCWRAKSPAKVSKEKKKKLDKLSAIEREPRGNSVKVRRGSAWDPVDSTFATASHLARSGAFKKKEWKESYKGKGPGLCTLDRDERSMTYPPYPPMFAGTGASMGYNKNLKIPRWATILAARYVYVKGQGNKKWKPTTSYAAPSLPAKHTVRLLTVAWEAFGVKGAQLRRNVRDNFAQIGLESGGSPQQIQLCDGSYADINCDNGNPARGMFQFIPSTFATWKVDGFNNIYNPLDNILAAVNAQVNSGMGYILNGSSGWGPGSGKNPYRTGGKAQIVNASPGDTANIKPRSYKGKPQKDAISKAVRRNAGGGSSCYVAYVKKWYDLIRKYPPQIAVGGLPGGARKLFQPRKFVLVPAKYRSCTSCTVDARILPNLVYLMKRYKMVLTQGRGGVATGSPSVSHGDGLAADLVPGAGGSWDLVGKSAELMGWRRSCGGSGVAPACPLNPAMRFVGYDGFPNHGAGNHLHLGWMSSYQGGYYGQMMPPQKWVMVFGKKQVGGGGGAGSSTNFSEDGRVIRGRVSWFDDSVTASGISAASYPGVAMNLRPGTDSGWNNNKTQGWIASARRGRPMCAKVTVRGRSKVMPVLDLGPAGWTRRAIDISVPGIIKMGWSRSSFPTDAKGKAQLLGRGKGKRCR